MLSPFAVAFSYLSSWLKFGAQRGLNSRVGVVAESSSGWKLNVVD